MIANNKSGEVKHISKNAVKVRDYLKKNIVIAHRGSQFWAPEETEATFCWARNIGADYLELDLQLTKDKRLIALHDSNLMRTSNVSEVFPDRADLPASGFTLKELRSLDFGGWFNKKFPERARDSFNGLSILTFKDVVKIAEGYHIKKKNGIPVKEMINGKWTGNYIYEKDPNENGNRPGLYAETKMGNLEKILAIELKELGWSINDNAKEIVTYPGKIDIANTNARFVLQSFSHESIRKLEKYLPDIPKCLLLWHQDMENDLKQNYIDEINFGVENNVHAIGPSIAGEPNNYSELTAVWMTDLIRQAGMDIHPYTFDTIEQFNEYVSRVDGVFTNRADLALQYYGRASIKTAQQVLEDLNY